MVQHSKLAGYGHLLAALRIAEDDLGLSGLTPLERSILAALSLPELENGARTEDIQNHRVVDAPTASSFYRALRSLKVKGFVETVGDRKTGIYRIVQ